MCEKKNQKTCLYESLSFRDEKNLLYYIYICGIDMHTTKLILLYALGLPSLNNSTKS